MHDSCSSLKVGFRFVGVLALLGCLIPAAAMAGVANPSSVRVRQPGGASLTLYPKGDESFHWTENAAGKVLTYNARSHRWEFGRASGATIVASGVQATAGAPSAAQSIGALVRARRAAQANYRSLQSQRVEAGSVDAGGATTRRSTEVTDEARGNQRLLVILVQYKDIKLRYSADYWRSVYFGTTSGAATVNNYYRSQSKDAFRYVPTSFEASASSTVTSKTASGSVIAPEYDEDGVPTGDVVKQSMYSYMVENAIASVRMDNGIAVVTFDKNHPTEPYGTDGDVVKAFHVIRPYLDTSSVQTINGYALARSLRVSSIIAGGEQSYGDVGDSDGTWGHCYTTCIDEDGFLDVNGYDLSLKRVLYNTNTDELLGFSTFGEVMDYTNGDGEGSYPSAIGIIVHELGHDLGLPDLYGTTGADNGIGPFSLMGSGSWGARLDQRPGQSPVDLDPWSRIHLGFVKPTVSSVANPGIFALKAPSSTSDYTNFNVLRVNSAVNADQYYLVENVARAGWNAGYAVFKSSASGSGVLIYHVDEKVLTAYAPNDNGDHLGIDVEESDGSDWEAQSTNRSAPVSAFWRYNGVRTFFPGTLPNTNFYQATSGTHPLVNFRVDCHPQTVASSVGLTVLDVPGNIMNVRTQFSFRTGAYLWVKKSTGRLTKAWSKTAYYPRYRVLRIRKARSSVRLTLTHSAGSALQYRYKGGSYRVLSGSSLKVSLKRGQTKTLYFKVRSESNTVTHTYALKVHRNR